MIRGNKYPIQSTPTTHYTGELSQNEAEQEEFPALRGDGDGYIQGVSLRALQPLDYQLEIWDADDNIISKVTLLASEAQVATVSEVEYSFYTVHDLNWPIPLTVPKTYTVTVALRNLSAEAKVAGTNGAVLVTLTIEK